MEAQVVAFPAFGQRTTQKMEGPLATGGRGGMKMKLSIPVTSGRGVWGLD